MWTRLNLLLVFAFGALYGQCLGFWPFDFVTGLSTQSLDSDQPHSGVKRIAVIGEFNLPFISM